METYTLSALADMIIVFGSCAAIGTILGTVLGHILIWIVGKICTAIRRRSEKKAEEKKDCPDLAR